MDNKQEIPARVHADDGISGFLVPACIDNLQEGIEKDLGSLLERNPIVLTRVLPGLVFVSDERDALQDKARILAGILAERYIQRQYREAR